MNYAALLGCLVAVGAFGILSTAAPKPPVDVERRLRVSESAPRGRRVGWIDDGSASEAARRSDQQNYFIVFPVQSGTAEKLLDVNDHTGEILVRNPLDYEGEKELHFIAMPAADSAPSAGVKVIVEIVDENDNAPRFPVDHVTLNISEAARLNTELALPAAVDADSGRYATQNYRIVSGNVNNMFRIASHFFDGIRYVDLILNSQLNREFRDRYDLVVEALDGGDPPRKGELFVYVVVLDANDNAPEFSRPRYFAGVPHDAPPDFPVAKITASDADIGDNGRVKYKIVTNEAHDAETSHYFAINEHSGLVTVASRQFADSKLAPLTTITVIVGAIDFGQPAPLESTAFLTITVEADGAGENSKVTTVEGEALPPALDIVWLTDDGTATVAENKPIGYVLARITMENTEHASRLTLSPASDVLCLRQTERPYVHLLIVCGALDREQRAVHTASLVLRHAAGGDVALDQPLRVALADVNDNAPAWPSPEWRITWNRQVKFNDVRLTASDADVGENARLRYTLSGTDTFVIHPETGRLSVTDKLDCTTEPLRFRVHAEDNGVPRLSAAADIAVELIGSVGPLELRFNQSLYEITVNESTTRRSDCISQLIAEPTAARHCDESDAPAVRYAIQRGGDGGENVAAPFRIDATSGRICLTDQLDFETSRYYELIVTADGGRDVKPATTRVLVHVVNADDNAPTFFSASHRFVLRANFAGDPLIAEDRVWQRALIVTARDPDSTDNNASAIVYSIQYPHEDNSFDTKTLREYFRIDSADGTVFVREPVAVTRLGDELPTRLQLKVSAADAAGHVSQSPATIDVDLLDKSADCGVPFDRRLYELTVAEDLLPGIAVGHVTLADPTVSSNYSLRIIDNDIGCFGFDESAWGKLVLHGELDAEAQDVFLLSVEVRHETDACRLNFTQVKITVQDVNDNAPVFLIAGNMSLTLAEDFPIHQPFFHVQAVDADRDENGRVVYELLDSYPPVPIIVDAADGALRLTAPLDRERVARYRLRVRARDGGVPPLFATTYVEIRVGDVNDNAPQFEKPVNSIDVSEDASLSQINVSIRASDADAADAGTITYYIAGGDEFFGVDAASGALYLRKPLNRERQDTHSFVVVAEDGGMPPLTSNTSVRVRVCDVNDHVPDCAAVGKLTIASGQLGESIGRIWVTDPDEGANAELTYRLQLPHPLFDVRPKGDIYLRRNLPTYPDAFTLSVNVEDGAASPMTTICRVEVRLNNAKAIDVTALPQVTVDPAVVTVSELPSPFLRLTGGLASGARLMNVAPSREGTPALAANSRYFQLVHESPTDPLESIFYLDELHGDLYLRDAWALRDALRARRVDDLELRVAALASDSTIYGAGPNHTTLVFDASAARRASSPTRFDALVYRWNMSETTEIGSIIGHVSLIDSPTGQPHFRITNEFGGCGGGGGDNAANCYFRIDAETGDVFLQRQLDSNTPRHVIVVEAAEQSDTVTNKPPTVNDDRENSCPTTVIVVEVIDENDHTPEFFSQPNCTLSEANAQRPDAPIHHFVAVDNDAGANARLGYEIVAGNERKIFELDPNSGALTVCNWTTLLARRFPLTLSVRATDGAPATAVRRHAVQIFTVFGFESSKMPENYFRPAGGAAFKFTMTADAPSNTVVHNFKRSDDSFGDVTFRVFPLADSAFVIGERDGVLKTTRALSQPSYVATVLALWRDGHGRTHADRATLTVRVLSATVRRPQLAAATCGDVAVPENAAISIVARIFAHVDSENGEASNNEHLHFRIEGGSGSRRLFSIDERTGVVSCSELDHEEKEEHLLVISVADDSTLPKVDVCTLRVRVLDDNDNAPRFDEDTTQNTVEIDDSAIVGGVLTRLRARDADAGANGRLRYQLSADRSRMLDVDAETGDLIFAREFAFTGMDWIINVTAEDCGATRILSTEKQFRIVWRRRPLAPLTVAELALRGRTPPRFLRRRYGGAVVENAPAGQIVARLETDWPTVAYRIVSGDADGAFTVDARGGLQTIRALDAERRAAYRIRVVAEPARGPSGGWTPPPETTVDVHVLGVNDNPPVFASFEPLTLNEDLALGTLVTTVTAVDADVGSALEYTLNPVSRHFSIGRYSGAIVLIRPLDRELSDKHIIGVQVYDGEHVTRANLTVRVRDVNDNAPCFDAYAGGGGALAELIVEDGGWPGAVLRRFSATDRDVNANGALRYALIGEAANATRRLFAVNESTGDLTLLRRLAEGDERFLEIRAADGGTPSRFAVLSVRVTSVRRENDKTKPRLIFNTPIIRLSLSENHPPFLPFANASVWLLPDGGGGPPTNWRVEPPAGPFAIHSISGLLYATVPLDREQVPEWRFRISIGPAFFDVFVDLIDENDNEPEFGSVDVSTIMADMVSGTVIARFNATDADALNNGSVAYELLAVSPSVPSMVRLNASSGALLFDRWDDSLVDELMADPSAIPSLVVTVGARDGGVPSRVTVAELAMPVDLSGWTGGMPQFPTAGLRKFVLETAPEGTRLFNAAAVSRLPSWHRHGWIYAIEYVGHPALSEPLLKINATTADVSLAGRLDYESLVDNLAAGFDASANIIRLNFRVSVADQARQQAAVPLELFIVGVDEFAPVFGQLSYTFQVPFDKEAGAWLGTVTTTDRDAGADGCVRYEWRADGRKTSLAKYFRLNATTGAIYLRRHIPPSLLQQARTAREKDSGAASIVRLTIVASSGQISRPLSSKAVVYFEIGKEPWDAMSAGERLRRAVAELGASTAAFMAIFGALLFCLVAVTMACLCCRRPGDKILAAENTAATKRRQVYSVANSVRLPLAADDMVSGRGALSPSPTLAKLRLPPPPRSLSGNALHGARADASDVCALLAAATAGGGNGGPLFQPDSSIDPDGGSLSSAAAVFPPFDVTAGGRTAQILSTHNFRPYQPSRNGPPLLYGDVGLR